MTTPDVTVQKWVPTDADKLGTQSGLGLALTYHHELSVIHAHHFAISMYNMPEHVLNHFRSGKLVHKPPIKGKVNVLVVVNTNQLFKLARKLLCESSHPYVRKVMEVIKSELLAVDPALSARLVPDCLYRGGYCFQTPMHQCGKFPAADINHYKTLQENVRT